MNLLDLLKAKTQQQNDVEFAPLQPITQDATQQATLQPIALNNDGTLQNNVAYVPEVKTTMADKVTNKAKQKTNKLGFSLVDALLGKQAEPTDTVGDMSATISNNPRSGGILRDIANGYQENRFNPISLDNFGQKKNFATRLGEGLGSLVRFGESPLGRSLIVGGIIGATGGNGLQALTYGSQTGALNQQYRNNDKIYRNDLIQSAQQQLMNSPEFNALSDAEKAQVLQETIDNYNNDDANVKAQKTYDKLTQEEQDKLVNDANNLYLQQRQRKALRDVEDNINGLRGYVTNDTYKNLINSQQIRDNYAYRNMMLNNQLEQNKIMNQLRQDQFNAQQEQQKFNNYIAQQNLEDKKEQRSFQASENAANRSVTMRGQDMNYYSKQEEKADKQRQDFEKANKDNLNILSQISYIRELVKRNPNAVGLAKGNTPGFILNRIDPKGVETRTAIDDLRTSQRHVLTGANFSPAEAREYEKFLVTSKDTPQIINAKLDAFENKIKVKMYGKGAMKSSNSGTKTVGKYKVRVK